MSDKFTGFTEVQQESYFRSDWVPRQTKNLDPYKIVIYIKCTDIISKNHLLWNTWIGSYQWHIKWQLYFLISENILRIHNIEKQYKICLNL